VTVRADGGCAFGFSLKNVMIHLMAFMPEGRTGVVMGLYSESENVGGMIYDSVGPQFSVLTVTLVLVANAALSYALIGRSSDSSNG